MSENKEISLCIGTSMVRMPSRSPTIAKTPVLLETPITSNSELRNLSCPLISESKLISEVVILISFLFVIF